MFRRFAHIILLFVVVLGLSGCMKRGRVISGDKLVDIYTEMFMLDQWLRETPAEKVHADTTAIYEPIFRKYGYTTLDYDATVLHYLDNPEKFSKILDKVTAKLGEEQKRLGKIKEQSDKARERNEGIKGYEHRELNDSTLNEKLYELFRQVSLQAGRDSNLVQHTEDSLQLVKFVDTTGPEKMLLPYGPDDTSDE